MDQDVRVDKWLWAARFYKTRALAQTALENGRVSLGGARLKRSRSIRIGDALSIRVGDTERTVIVLAVSGVRASATVAQMLYEETAQSIASREAAAQRRRLHSEPAQAIEQGRPTKRERRDLERWRSGGEP